MKPQNVLALKKAWETAFVVQQHLAAGNSEAGHRASQMYQTLLLTIILTELVPDATELLEEWDKELGAEIPMHATDGTVIN